MLAIHHIKGIKAIPGHSPSANYITLVFEGKDLEGPLRAEVVLYFDNPLEGSLHFLAEGINSAVSRTLMVAFNKAVQADLRQAADSVSGTSVHDYSGRNEDIGF
jgi:hypothetical protein